MVFRYINVNYAVTSTLVDDVDAGIEDIVVTYNIGCQWGKHTLCCFKDLPSIPFVDTVSLNSFCVAVPKFHIIGHGASCQASYNLVYMDAVGMTHREGMETIWSHSTSLTTWSRENGPAAHYLILDNHWARWNWQKLVGLHKFSSPMLNTSRLTLS